jgi:predicted RND superfamily exporter protein
LRRLIFAILLCFFAYQMQGLAPAIRLLDQFDQSLASTNQLKEIRRQFEDLTQFQIIEKRQENISCQEIISLREIYIQEPLIERLHMAWDFSQLSLENERLQVSSIKSPCLMGDSPNWSLLQGRRSEDFLFSSDKKFMVHHFFASTQMGDQERMERFAKLRDEHKQHQKESHPIWVGILPLEYFTWIGIQYSQIMNILVFLAVWIVLFWLHGSWRSGALFWFTVIVSLIFVYGGMTLLGQKQTVLSICLFVMITVASLEDYLFLCHHEYFGTQHWRKAFHDLRFPSFLTSLTTAIGFGSLVFSNLDSIRWFGFWAAIGAMIEWLIVFEILPELLERFPQLQFAPKRREKQLLFKGLLKFKLKSGVALLALLVFLTPLFGPEFILSQSPEKTFPPQHELRQSVDLASKWLGWEGVLELVFPVGQRPKEVIEWLQKSPQVRSVYDFSILSQDLIDNNWSHSLQNEVQRLLKSSNESKLFFSSDGQKERAFVFIQDLEVSQINALSEQASTACGTQCQLSGELIVFAEQSLQILKTLVDSFYMSLILVLLILIGIGWTRGYRWKIIPILISAAWGPFAILFIIQFFQIEVNFVTCIILSVLVGLTGDNAIQYFYADQDINQGSEKMGFASLWVMITMVLVSLMFLFSYFDPPRHLGLLLALGFLLSYWGDYYLLRFWTGRDQSK